ncbi:MAG: hypothetical protein IT286_02250 [Proteobacteria bacterium]|nr:hypothetical protein [Pseudomonadota bacterium]
MGGKLDQNLAEMKSMNKNMEQMNKNIAAGMTEFNGIGQSFKTLSDETVSFLKKTDPQQYFDMFEQISNKFETMLAGLLDQTGDIKNFVEQANDATGLFLKYSQALTPEDMVAVKDSIDKIAGMTETINKVVGETGNVEAMMNQVLLTTQMFTAMGLSIGQSLDVVDSSDANEMISLMETNMKNMNMMESTKKLSETMMDFTKKTSKKAKSSKLTLALNGLVNTVIPEMKKLSNIWTDDQPLNKKWDDMDTKYLQILCYAAYGLYEVIMMDPAGPNPFTDDQQKSVKARYEKIKPICEAKKKKDPTFDWMTPPNNGTPSQSQPHPIWQWPQPEQQPKSPFPQKQQI